MVGGFRNLPSGHVAIHRSDPTIGVDDSLFKNVFAGHVSHTYAVV